jgi:hypothetical protein
MRGALKSIGSATEGIANGSIIGPHVNDRM